MSDVKVLCWREKSQVLIYILSPIISSDNLNMSIELILYTCIEILKTFKYLTFMFHRYSHVMRE